MRIQRTYSGSNLPEPGIHVATLESIEEVSHPEFGERLLLTWATSDDKVIRQYVSRTFSERSRLMEVAAAIIGKEAYSMEYLDTDILLGGKAFIDVTEREGRRVVEKVMGLPKS